MTILRGELYFVELGPTRGREIDAKRRPVLVISINYINRKQWVVTVIPGKTKDPADRSYKEEALVQQTPSNGLTNLTAFRCDQLKAVDHSRFDKPPIGVVSAADLQRIEDTVKFCLGLV
ncbi:MAG TPA: type II toxin-antitoxin system PemK/MazF family toxin [Gemmataceae bacterium]|nr:type II toxin-antitoxin system PemK/MazF family toxin [Gemmataceae bacterium]